MTIANANDSHLSPTPVILPFSDSLLVISSPDLQRKHGLSWVLMITSAQHRGWEGDVEIDDLAEAGLPAPSVVRGAKIGTIDSRDAEPLGRVPKKVLVEVIGKANALLKIER